MAKWDRTRLLTVELGVQIPLEAPRERSIGGDAAGSVVLVAASLVLTQAGEGSSPSRLTVW